MKMIKKGILYLLLLCLSIATTSCEHDTHFLEDRIVGTWVNVEDDGYEYIERTLTFLPDGHWSGVMRTEDRYGIYVDTDMGIYDIRRNELLLESYIYDDVTVYGIEIRNNRLYLWDDYGELVYYRN